MAWRNGPGSGRVLAIVIAVVSGIALTAVGLFLYAIAINQGWDGG